MNAKVRGRIRRGSGVLGFLGVLTLMFCATTPHRLGIWVVQVLGNAIVVGLGAGAGAGLIVAWIWYGSDHQEPEDATGAEPTTTDHDRPRPTTTDHGSDEMRTRNC